MRDPEWDSARAGALPLSRARKREGELGAYGTQAQGYALNSGELALAEISKPLEKNGVDSAIERAAVEMGLVLTEAQVGSNAGEGQARLDKETYGEFESECPVMPLR